MVESDGSEEAAEAVENLLESYFMQIDGTYDRLVSICKLSPLLSDCSADHKLGLRGSAGTVAYLSQDWSSNSIISFCISQIYKAREKHNRI